MGEQRWLEAESFRRAKDLAAFAAIAVATAPAPIPGDAEHRGAAQVVDGYKRLAAVRDPPLRRGGIARALVERRIPKNPSLNLSSRLTPAGVNPAVLPHRWRRAS